MFRLDSFHDGDTEIFFFPKGKSLSPAFPTGKKALEKKGGNSTFEILVLVLLTDFKCQPACTQLLRCINGTKNPTAVSIHTL